mmetsp:Transcript_5019/g.12591  ORF Transcript_5019/g.12591 Transcript_5019/m.12591 type:complete len:80 (-) Transcript_5019:89-328(-)
MRKRFIIGLRTSSGGNYSYVHKDVKSSRVPSPGKGKQNHPNGGGEKACTKACKKKSDEKQRRRNERRLLKKQQLAKEKK